MYENAVIKHTTLYPKLKDKIKLNDFDYVAIRSS